MKIVIDIPEKTNAHIRSDYGHGMKCLLNNDVEILCDAIYHCSPYEERPLGEWIFNEDGNYECSRCGIAWKDMPVKDAKPVFKACPWCGIEMRDDVTDMKHIKVGNVIYTQDDDKQGWTGKEVE